MEDDWNLITEEVEQMGMFSSIMEFAKSKLYNILQYYPREVAKFSYNPIWLLGEKYQINKQDGDGEELSVNNSDQLFEFLLHFKSIIWFTYRSHFPTLYNSRWTSDCGWGCMIRSGQMMLASAFTRIHLGKDWRINEACEQSWIIQLFKDEQSPHSPYSLPNILRLASQYNVQPGEWFGPTLLIQILKILVSLKRPLGLNIHICKDRIIYKQNIIKLCKVRPPSNSNINLNSEPLLAQNNNNNNNNDQNGDYFAPVLLLMPVRLGINSELNQVYSTHIKMLLTLPQSIGLIGGKPNFSYYFVGFQDNDLIYLDPHFVFKYVAEPPVYTTIINEYSCNEPLKIDVNKIDPSMAFAFLCNDKDDFDNFCEMLKIFEETLDPPLFSIIDSEQTDVIDEKEESAKKLARSLLFLPNL